VQYIFKLEVFAEISDKFSNDEQLYVGVFKRAHEPYSVLNHHAYWIHSLSIRFIHQVRLSSPLQPEPLATAALAPPTPTGARNNSQERCYKSPSRAFKSFTRPKNNHKLSHTRVAMEATATPLDLIALINQPSVYTSRRPYLSPLE